MGICVSVDSEAARRNLEIENQIKQDLTKSRTECKLLLLGAGESGKSTVLKQMKIINSQGYTDDERRGFKPIINSNIVYSMKTICQAMEKLNISVENESCQSSYNLLMQQPDQIFTETLNPQLARAIMQLWDDQGVQACIKKAGAEYHLNDSAKYFFQNLERISTPGYLPSDQDILRSRVKTTGIVETSFFMNKNTYRMFDVGGQRSERKKWIHCFENVNAIIFLAAISEYDQKLVEDEEVNRMQEAFSLFDSIATSRFFQSTSIILFLNKMDILEEKIYDVPIEEYFDDYEGGADIEEAKRFFKSRFEEIMPENNQGNIRKLYTHFTCATDTTAMKVVMDVVSKIIQQESLQRAGLI